QGVLLDNNSMNVIYDYVRGEPRGKIRKNAVATIEEPPQGDCVDCTLCVQVCPTGIDIRNGIQMECVNCTACMDACDEVMIKVNRPTGLIRLDSERGVKEGNHKLATPRVMGYSAVLLVLFGIFISLLWTRSDLEATVTRFRGMTELEREGGEVSNLYGVSFINKSCDHQNVELRPVNPDYRIEVVGDGNCALCGPARFEGRFLLGTAQDKIVASRHD